MFRLIRRFWTKLFHKPVNVKDYGAVGDGVTDDTNAFQKALDSRRGVFVPADIYSVSGLTFGAHKIQNCSFKGDA